RLRRAGEEGRLRSPVGGRADPPLPARPALAIGGLMRRNALRAALACGLLLVPALTLTAIAKTHDPSADFTQGDWKIDSGYSDDPAKVQLQLHSEWSDGRGDHSNISSSFDLNRADLAGLKREDWNADHADVAFELVRDAGTIHFQGVMRHGRGLGEYTFEANQKFADELEHAGFESPTSGELMRLVIHDIDRAWLRGFDGRHMSIDDVVRFKVHGVTPQFVNTMAAGGYRDMSADDLVRLKVHSVDPQFVPRPSGLGH